MIYGIDVSSNNEGQVLDATGLSFAVVKVSEGDDYLNPDRFTEAEWAVSHGLTLAVYHWTKPWQSAAAQFANFVNGLKGMPSWEWWAQDEEDGSQPASDQEWAQSVSAILTLGRNEWPDKHMASYVGQFFHSATLLPIALDNFWWDPDYGNDDGQVHPILNGRRPVIHQYSSANHLDRNVVVDEAAYAQLRGVAPAPAPKRRSGVNAITFFTIPDHPVEEARATVYASDGPFKAHSLTPEEEGCWQFIELAHGAVSADVQVGHLPWAVAQRIEGVFQPPAAPTA